MFIYWFMQYKFTEFHHQVGVNNVDTIYKTIELNNCMLQGVYKSAIHSARLSSLFCIAHNVALHFIFMFFGNPELNSRNKILMKISRNKTGLTKTRKYILFRC